MDRHLTDKEKEFIVNFGALSYNPNMMQPILEWDIKEIEKEFKNENSELKTHYNKGNALADYVLNVKLFEMAKSGDLKAMQQYRQLIDRNKRV